MLQVFEHSISLTLHLACDKFLCVMRELLFNLAGLKVA